MMSRGEQSLPYAGLLRTIGQFVDDRQGDDLAIMELADRFVVRYRTPATGETTSVELRIADLRREATSREHSRRLRFGLSDSNGLSNRLRAIGRELERLGAYAILVESTVDQFVVSYQYSDPRKDYALHKSVEALSEVDVREIAAGAQWQRRAPRKHRFLAG